MRSDPAEAAPNGKVAYAALAIDPSGEIAPPIDWAFCTKPKPLADLGDVAIDCFVLQADHLVPLGVGAVAAGKIPGSACHQFGPDGPQAAPGEPPGRPIDPDLSGGYYQPVRLLAPEGDGYLLAAGATRIGCGLAGATSEALQAFKQAYRANQNPSIDAVTADGRTLAPEGPPLEVAAGAELHLAARWPECPAAPCAGAEPYAHYDPIARTVGARTESMLVSWFATAGSFASDRSGETAPRTSENTFTAPAGDVTLWLVLRDDRGGTAWHRYRLRGV